MSSNYLKHLVSNKITAFDALKILNELAIDAILFVVNETNVLQGSLTDGDIRRGLLGGFDINDSVIKFIQPNPHYLLIDKIDINKIASFRDSGFKVIPIVDENIVVIDVLNLRFKKSYLPIKAVIMAGGRGVRLKPLTDNTPKPLLHVGDKPLIHTLVNHLCSFGIKDISISVNYLKEKIISYFETLEFDTAIKFYQEDKPLGTIGSVKKISFAKNDIILLINSDILTNLNIEEYLSDFIDAQADISIFTIPHKTEISYGVVELADNRVIKIKEKPSYVNQINTGIYLISAKMIGLIPEDSFYNATDLIEQSLANNYKVISYSSTDYWLDIGRIEDYEKSQEDIKNLYK